MKFQSQICIQDTHSPIYFNATIYTSLKINLIHLSLFQKRKNMHQNYCHYLEKLNQYYTNPLLAVKNLQSY